jgi:hypothetical protein
MRLDEPPPSGSWTHTGVRTGFEVVFLDLGDARPRLRGQTTAREGPSLWSVSYRIELAEDWSTRSAEVTNSTAAGERRTFLARTPDGRWTVDGQPRPDLDGCVDVDLESSGVTNTLPVHRIEFAAPGAAVQVPAAFVRAEDLRVERIDQTYALISRSPEELRLSYVSTTFDFQCELTFDSAGLILTYPGIATRDS